MNINGNTILITGGTRGIGRALAEAFHAEKNNVVIARRRQDLLDAITRQNPGMVALPLDVNDANPSMHLLAKSNNGFPR